MKTTPLAIVFFSAIAILFGGISCKHGHGGGGGEGPVYTPAPSGSGGNSGSGTTGTSSTGFITVAGNGSTIVSMLVCDHEVTQGEYEKFCFYGSDIGSSVPNSFGKGINYPAYYISWYSALVYCNLRSLAEGLTPCYSIGGETNPACWTEVQVLNGKYSGPYSSNHATWDAVTCNASANGYRLPTSAEWEYLAKGGSAQENYTYSGSDTIGDVAWYNGNSITPTGTTHEVKGKAANSLGLYDMSGNVDEWCWDFRLKGHLSGRIYRGGFWGSYAYDCEVSHWYNELPGCTFYNIGCRVVRTAQ